ncbi:MAG: AbrB/MazE/SpoVT family DNA-binding domain-containing protein [Phyllobacteriaceae bacterium]|nr:AbrB/MazE/SpoVT family DNA-binding domain-containing protein [Phyllobacteriaceae bacterium]
MNASGKSGGFAETPQKDDEPPQAVFLATPPKRETVKLGEGGRFVIPAALREAMGVKPGDTLVMHVEDGELRVRNWREAIKRIQQMAQKYKRPGESVVDDFLRDRRAMWGEE